MKLLCFFGHKYRVMKAFNFTARCVTCERCKKFWAMNDEVRAFVPWDGTFSKLHEWSPFDYDQEIERKL